MLVLKFRIGGSLRFLSHAQMLRVFQRACVRAGLKIQYSQGFNPRPKISLPLPRPVGVASDDELLCLRLHKSTSAQVHKSTRTEGIYDLCTFVKAQLTEQLPQGCELLSVSIAESNTSFRPSSATYVLSARQEYLNEELKATIKRLLASESLNLQRRIDKRESKIESQKSKLKNIDVRGFLKSIELDGNSIIVECKIGSTGSIRVEEILKLLQLDDVEKLALPIRRTNVQWQKV